MAKVSTEYKRLFLRGVKWDATGTTTLADVLKALAQASYASTKAGEVKVITGASVGSVQYSLPQNGRGLTPETAAELIGEMLDRYDKAVSDLGGTPSDDAIYAEMMANLMPVRRTRPDFSTMTL